MDFNTKKEIKRKLTILENCAVIILIPLSVFFGCIMMNKFLFNTQINIMHIFLFFIFLCLPFAISFTLFEIAVGIVIKPYLNGLSEKEFFKLLDQEEEFKIQENNVSNKKEEKYINGIKVLEIKKANIKKVTPCKAQPRTLSKEEIKKLYKRCPYLKKYIEK